MSEPRPRVIVVTGIQAAGKSTVARLLAERFKRGVHIEADVLQQMIVSGGEWITEPGVIGGAAARQLRLRLHNACLLAVSFLDAGFTPVIDDIIIGERFDQLKSELAGLPFELIVLAPSPVIVAAKRDEGRGKRVLGEKWARYLDDALRETMAGEGIWVDSSDQTPEETVREIIRRLDLRPTA
ncbi:MAG: phosphotransferase [Chloroflexi bacterium]|nr:MAG: phosphotransferase [Chloroflexota bacterium]